MLAKRIHLVLMQKQRKTSIHVSKALMLCLVKFFFGGGNNPSQAVAGFLGDISKISRFREHIESWFEVCNVRLLHRCVGFYLNSYHVIGVVVCTGAFTQSYLHYFSLTSATTAVRIVPRLVVYFKELC